MSTTGTKVPAIIDIPADIDPKVKRVLDSMKEASEIRLGRRGDPRDRAITLRELIDSGLATELRDKPFDPNAGTGVTDFALPVFLQPDPSAPVPPAATGLSAGAAFTTITLSWNDPQISNLAFTEVWRNGSDNLGSATRVDTVSANVWSDTVDTAQTFYYWVRHVNTNNVTGTFSSSVNATTAQVNAARIENAVIDNTKLVNKTLTNTKIADGTITSDILAANSVIAGKIATNAIVANDGVIGTAAIATAQIVDAAIVNAKIADLAVDATKIANATITNAKISDLNASKINAGTISADRIAANSVNGVLKGTAHTFSTIKVSGGTTANFRAIVSDISSTGAIISSIGGTGFSGGHYGYRFAKSGSFGSTFGAATPYWVNSANSVHLKRIASIPFTVTSNTQGTYFGTAATQFFGAFSGDEENYMVVAFGTSGFTPQTYVESETNGTGATGTADNSQADRGQAFVDTGSMGVGGFNHKVVLLSNSLTAGTYYFNVWGGVAMHGTGFGHFYSTFDFGIFRQHI